MDYKTILVNSSAYGKISDVKGFLSKESGSSVSFSDVIVKVLGKNIDFLDINTDLRKYIKIVGSALGKNRQVCGVLLFGSVAKVMYNAYSDIDLLLIVDNTANKIEILEYLSEIRKTLQNDGSALFRMNMPSSISPMILHVNELDDLMPIYFDFADYGIILYDYKDTVADFLNRIDKIHHKREYTRFGEVVKWPA